MSLVQTFFIAPPFFRRFRVLTPPVAKVGLSALFTAKSAPGGPVGIRVTNESKHVQVSDNARTERRQDRAHLIQPFPHPVPLDLKTASVADDVPEAAGGTQFPRQLSAFSSSAVTKARGPAFR